MGVECYKDDTDETEMQIHQSITASHYPLYWDPLPSYPRWMSGLPTSGLPTGGQSWGGQSWVHQSSGLPTPTIMFFYELFVLDMGPGWMLGTQIVYSITIFWRTKQFMRFQEIFENAQWWKVKKILNCWRTDWSSSNWHPPTIESTWKDCCDSCFSAVNHCVIQV